MASWTICWPDSELVRTSETRLIRGPRRKSPHRPRSRRGRPKSRLSPTPEPSEDLSDVQTLHQKRRRSRLASPARFGTSPGQEFPERASSAISIPRKRRSSLSSALGVAREPSVTQLCLFRIVRVACRHLGFESYIQSER